MKNLIIYTNNYPYGVAESFLGEELEYLSKYIPSIHIIPLFYVSDSVRKVPANVTFSEPVFKYNFNLHKIRLFFDGVLNMSPVFYFLKEAWVKFVFFNPKHFINWLSFTCIHRVLLKKKIFNNLTEKISTDTILYFYWGDKPSGIVPFLKRKFSNPVIVRFHGSDVFEEVKNGYIPCRETLFTSLDNAVFISRTGENYVRQKYPSLKFHSQVFRLGVNFHGTAKASSDGIFRIVSCSNVIHLKRVNIILDALMQCPGRIHWVHFGDGPLLDELKEKSKTRNKDLTVNFKGQVTSQEIFDFYMSNPVDLFINVSESEGIPVSIMEAISFAIPVIATEVGGVSEIVSDSMGKLLPKAFLTSELVQIINDFRSKPENEISTFKENAFKVWERDFDAQTNYTLFTNFVCSIKV
jgi:colanic acid/amylovoran biosynthesis glycosyltransferase